jgi:GNAT superfamily N-acetyltransferase
MARSGPLISRLAPQSPEQLTCARWRHEAFLKEDGFSVDNSYAQLSAILARADDNEAALVAHVDGALAGICLLVQAEIDPLHDVSPWLASLYVHPPFRRQGVATALIHAIEEQARRNGVRQLYLYTVDAEALYQSCGWLVEDRVMANGLPVVLMCRELVG